MGYLEYNNYVNNLFFKNVFFGCYEYVETFMFLKSSCFVLAFFFFSFSFKFVRCFPFAGTDI